MIARSNIWHGKLTSLSDSLPRAEAPMTPPFSRRFILAGASLSAASLLIPIVVRETRALPSGNEDYEITDWIIIAASGQVTLGLSQPEVGQGSYTALPQILADELDADWERVEVRFVTGRPPTRSPSGRRRRRRKKAPRCRPRRSTSGFASPAPPRARCSCAPRRRSGTSTFRRAAPRTASSSTRGERLSYGQLAPDCRQASARARRRR